MPVTQQILDNCRRAADEWQNAALLCEQMLPMLGDEGSQQRCRIMAERYRTSARAQLVLMQGLAQTMDPELKR